MFLMSVIQLAVFIGCSGDVEPETTGGEGNENESGNEKRTCRGLRNCGSYSCFCTSIDWDGQGVMETKLIAWHVFEQCDGDEDNEVKPMLAKDYDEEDDGLTYVLHLREDVKFHEGSTMESEDVLAFMEHWKEVASA